MKAIVDSKVLHKAIQKAIKYDTLKTNKIVTVVPRELKLGKIKVPLSPTDKNIIHYSNFEFDIEKWIKVMTFLYSIPHQPIVCEFDSETISIHCIVNF